MASLFQMQIIFRVSKSTLSQKTVFWWLCHDWFCYSRCFALSFWGEMPPAAIKCPKIKKNRFSFSDRRRLWENPIRISYIISCVIRYDTAWKSSNNRKISSASNHLLASIFWKFMEKNHLTKIFGLIFVCDWQYHEK